MAADLSWTRAARTPLTHARCPVCRQPMTSWRLMCLRHWRMVPSELKWRMGRARHHRNLLAAVKAEAVALVRGMEVGGEG